MPYTQGGMRLFCFLKEIQIRELPISKVLATHARGPD